MGNRPVYPNHIVFLTKAIARKNLLPFEPILINEKNEIIDGQHRLKIAKDNNLYIYYIVAQGANLQDIQMLNSSSKSWSQQDYLESYAKQGNKHYQRLIEYKNDSGITLGNLLNIFLNFQNTRSIWPLFKQGLYEIKNEQEGEMILNSISKIKLITKKRIWNDREFINALIKTLKVISIDEFMGKIETFAKPIEYDRTVRNYLRQFEEIINFGKKTNIIRLI